MKLNNEAFDNLVLDTRFTERRFGKDCNALVSFGSVASFKVVAEATPIDPAAPRAPSDRVCKLENEAMVWRSSEIATGVDVRDNFSSGGAER